jgi:hypothetical protein
MNDNDHGELIGRQPQARRRTFDALLERGTSTALEVHEALGLDSDPGATRTRVVELAKLGLVRQRGSRGGKKLWEVTPAAEVEAAAEAAAKTGPRRRPVTDRDLDERVASLNDLLADPEVREAFEDPAGSSTKRQRAKVKSAAKRAERERARQLRELEVENHPTVEAIRVRKVLKDMIDHLRSLRVMNEDEWDRRRLLDQELVPDAEWERILRLIEELERHADETYAFIARMCGVAGRPPARREFDFEIDDVEDVDYHEVGNGNGDLADLIVALGGTTQLQLPPPAKT